MAFWNSSQQTKPSDDQQKLCDDAEAIAGDVAIIDLLKQQSLQSDRHFTQIETPDTPAL